MNARDPLGLCKKNTQASRVNAEAWKKALAVTGAAELIGVGTKVAVEGFGEVGPWSFVAAFPFYLTGGALAWNAAGGPDLVTPLANALPDPPDPGQKVQEFIHDSLPEDMPTNIRTNPQDAQIQIIEAVFGVYDEEDW